MAIIHESDGQRDMTFIVWDGEVIWDDWLKHMEELMADPEWRRLPRFIADLQTVSDTSTIGDDAIKQAAALISANREILAKKTGAVVADEEFWRARRFGELLSEFGTSTVVFNTLDIACLFLNLDVAETRQTLKQLRAKLRING